MTDEATAALRVLLVDDHHLLTQALSMGLEQRAVEVAIAELGSTEQVLEQAARHRPDVVLLDLDLGGAIGNGELLVGPLVDLGLRVIVVSATTTAGRFGAALELGASGVLAKSTGFADLLDAVVAGAEGREVISAERRRELLSDLHRTRNARNSDLTALDRLSETERGVLDSLVSGLSVGRIATDRFVAESTVRSQVRAILQKLGVNSQLEAVALAARVQSHPRG